MSDPRHGDTDLTHRSPPDLHGEVRPTDALYADRGSEAFSLDATTPHSRRRDMRWGRIALIAAAVILGLALLSALFTGVNRDGSDFAATTASDPVVTGTVPDSGAVVIEPEAAVPGGAGDGASNAVPVPAD